MGIPFLTCSVTVRPVTNSVINLPTEFLFIHSVCRVGDNVDWSWTLLCFALLGLTERVFRACFTWTCSITVRYELRGCWFSGYMECV